MNNNVNRYIVSVYGDLPTGGARNLFKLNLKYLKKKYIVNEYSDHKNLEKITNILNYYSYIFYNLIKKQKFIDEINQSNILIAYSSWVTKSPILLRHVVIPIIYICHEPPREFYDQDYISMFSFKDRLINFIGKIIKIIDIKNILLSKKIYIVSNSLKSKKNIKVAYNLDSNVIYPGLEINYFKGNSVLKERKNQIICVGSINKLKNQFQILKCVARIPINQRPKIILVGNGGNKDYIRKLQKFAISNNISLELHINISITELRSLYLESKIFVYSSVNEPFGIVVLEAMSSGLPIVAHTKGGYSEIINKNSGFLLNNYDLEIWAKSIIKLLGNSLLWKRCSKNNILLSKKYTAARMNNELNKLIQNILKSEKK